MQKQKYLNLITVKAWKFWKQLNRKVQWAEFLAEFWGLGPFGTKATKKSTQKSKNAVINVFYKEFVQNWATNCLDISSRTSKNQPSEKCEILLHFISTYITIP